MKATDKDIERLVLGELSAEEEISLRAEIESDAELKEMYEAFKLSQSSFEYEIANQTRKHFTVEIQKDSLDNPSIPNKRILILSGIAATLILLILSFISINISHNDTAIADAYHINDITLRDDSDTNNKVLSDAIKAYYMNDFIQSKALINNYVSEDNLTNEYISWLKVLLLLKTEKSSSEAFEKALNSILNDRDHEFYSEAVEMDNQLSNFWRRLIVKK